MLRPASSATVPGCARTLPATALPAPVRKRLLDDAGGRPFSGYLYDPAVAAERASALRSTLPEWARLLFAVKACSFPPVLSALAAGGVAGFEVASAHEAGLARQVLGRGGGRLVAAGPAKHHLLIGELLGADVDVLHAESILELRRISRLAQERGVVVAVALRVNPARVAVSGTLAMGGRPSPFGLAEPRVREAVELAQALPGVDLVGFHVHAVCGNRDARAHVRYVRWCLDWAVDAAREHRLDLRWLDVGGGLGVSYDGSAPLCLDTLAEELGRLRPPAGIEVGLEPGRWLAADCGWYATEVVDVKESFGRRFVVVRGGIGGFALPATEDFPFAVAVVPVDHWPEPHPRPELRDVRVDVVGELCTPEDVLVRDVTVDRVRPGDLVVVPRAGAYGWEFALQRFLGHPIATREVLPAATGPGDGADVPTTPTLEVTR